MEIFFTRNIITKTYYIYSFPMLRNTKLSTIKDFIESCVSQLFQGLKYDLKSSPLIMFMEIFNIFHKQHLGVMEGDNSRDIKE